MWRTQPQAPPLSPEGSEEDFRQLPTRPPASAGGGPRPLGARGGQQPPPWAIVNPADQAAAAQPPRYPPKENYGPPPPPHGSGAWEASPPRDRGAEGGPSAGFVDERILTQVRWDGDGVRCIFGCHPPVLPSGQYCTLTPPPLPPFGGWGRRLGARWGNVP